MVVVESAPVRAKTHDAIKPLVELCKAGKLFEVQEWIAAGEPVNPPEHSKRTRRRSPLEYAIDRGFHSLVRVLLDGGALCGPDGNYCPMHHAIGKRRLDIAELLVHHGYDVQAVDMRCVFASWDPEMMEYFIKRGADLETDHPLAWALCSQIRTAFGVLKRYRDRFSSFPEQANIALRHHCKSGNLKWVSLLLYAGADPLLPGAVNPGEEMTSDDPGISALAYAALYSHFEIFSLRKIRLDASHPAWRDIAPYLCKSEGIQLLKTLLEGGMDPNDQENGGASLIQTALYKMDWAGRFASLNCLDCSRGIDTQESRDLIKIIHLAAKYGGRWVPKDSYEVNAARRSLVKMKADYTVEFVWIMAKYKACSREHIEALLRTLKMKKHTATCRARLAELVGEMKHPDDTPDPSHWLPD